MKNEIGLGKIMRNEGTQTQKKSSATLEDKY